MSRLNIVSQHIIKTSNLLKNKQSNKLLVIGSAFILTLTAAPQIYAEDIEIYDSLSGEGAFTSAEEIKPNLMFIMDTSGSMSESEPVLISDPSVRPEYDPNVTYGNSDNSDIYIYDTSRTYTGNFVPESRNNCLGATEFHATNPAFPEFFDRALVWQQVSTAQAAGESGSWVIAVDPADVDEIQALECELDDGTHGPTNASAEVFLQRQEATNTSFNPNYTSDGGDPNRIIWGSEFPERYLYPGNYHDYLQAPVEELLGDINPVQNTDANVTQFCNRRANAGVYVTDGTDTFLCISRMRSLKEAANNIFSTIAGTRVGMARFNTSDGGSIITAIDDIDVPGEPGELSHRQTLLRDLWALPAGGNTPLQESLNEVKRYFAGEGARLSILRSQKGISNEATEVLPSFNVSNDIITSPAALVDVDDVSSITSEPTYASPILSECQDSSIILFSDGTPTQDVDDVDEILSFSGRANCGGNIPNGACLDDLAFGLANRDINGDPSDGDNRVFVYTIAFGSDIATGRGANILRNTSNQGLRPGAAQDSQFFTASDSSDLVTIFQSITRDLTRVDAANFATPAVSVDAFNRLQFNDEVYFASFRPNDRPRWTGNIKGFRIDPNTGEFLDDNGNPAVDPNTGGFFDTSQSFWSDQPDGNNVTSGGFTEQLDLSSVRQLYANINSDDINNPVVQLTEADFLTTIDDPGISTVTSIGAIGVGDDLQLNRENIVAWTFGQDVDSERGGDATDPNFFIGETLHNSPYVLDFGSANTTDPDIDFDSDPIVFASTNQGMIHAIDADSGEELWSYIPDASLFKNLGDYYNNLSGAPHTYGLDGGIAFDVNRDPATLELTRGNIFVGQRRGGSNYFAIDISNADSTVGSPVSKLWTLSDLPRMGQSWSTPILANINFCSDGDDAGTCTNTEVLVISGGYDIAYDTFVNPAGDPVSVESRSGIVNGNAVYIVERSTGELLWVAGRPGEVEPGFNESYAHYTNDDMTHSFPSEPTVIDIDGDGVHDLMFVADIAGRVWRFDFSGNVIVDNNNTPTNPADDIVTPDTNDIVLGGNNNNDEEVSGGIIADFSEPGVDRRFYNSLDISITARTETDTERYNIVVGSGYRAHPRAQEIARNRIYFAFDRNLRLPQQALDDNGVVEGITYDYVDTTDVANNINIDELSPLAPGAALDTTLVNRHGFFIELNQNEKLINPTLTNTGTVVATSYVPTTDEVVAGVVCQRGIGNSFLYSIDLGTGDSSSFLLDAPGISSRPVIIEVPDSDGNPSKILFVDNQVIEVIPSTPVEEPVVPLDPSENGQVKRLNWWERDRSLIE